MSERFFIHGASVVLGDAPHTSRALQKWLRQIPFSNGSGWALCTSSTRTTRRGVLADSVDQVGQFAADLKRVSWDEFKTRPFHGYTEAVVIGTQVADEDQHDGAVALHVSRIDGPVKVEFGREDGVVLPAVPDCEVSSLLRMAFAYHCVVSGVLPGQSEPRLWWARERTARIGRWAVSCTETIQPLSFYRPEVFTTRADSMDDLVSNIATSASESKGVLGAAIVAEPWDMRSKLDEAMELAAQGRRFSNGIWIEDARPRKAMFVTTGPFELSPRTGSSLAVSLPNWREAYPSTLKNSTWTGGSQQKSSRSAQHVAIGEWFARQLYKLTSSVFGDHEVLAESIAGRYFVDNKTTYDSELWSELLAGDFASLREWFAAQSDVAGATAEEMRWQSWLMVGPVEFVAEKIAEHPQVFMPVIRTSNECIISGTPEALDEVLLDLLNSPRVMATELHFSAVLHCDPARSGNEAWKKWWKPAEAPAMVHETLDLRKAIKQARTEGFETFIDIGPTGQFANWVDRELGETQRVCVPTSRIGVWGPIQLFNAAARLEAAGMDVDFAPLQDLGVEAPELNWVELPEEQQNPILNEIRELQHQITRIQAEHLRFESQLHDAQIKAGRAATDALLASLDALLSESKTAP